MRSHHSERLAEQLRTELALLIESDVRDPRVASATVTEVHMAPDMRQARVLVSVAGDEKEQRTTLQGLTAAAGFLRHALAEALSLRHTPELTFEVDRGPASSARVEELLKRIKK